MKKSIALLACGLFAGLALRSIPFVSGASAASSKRCDYTYIGDTGTPEIGKNGKIEYDEDWKKVIEAGWVLKAVGGLNGQAYLFEKCQ